MPTLLSLSVGPPIAVDHAFVVVGRHPECDAQLDSHRVSRRHCILSSEGADVVVRDLGSKNGTWINGQRVALGRLRPGDEVSIAHFRYRLAGASMLWPTLAHSRPVPASDESFQLQFHLFPEEEF